MPAPLRRLASALAVLATAGALVWGLMLLSPVDPARQILLAQGDPAPAPAEVDATRHELGLDRSYPEQYARWLTAAVRGDFGTSWRTGDPVAAELAGRLPATIRLTLVALLFATAVALALALPGLERPGGPADVFARGLVFGGSALPVFAVGVVLLEFVVVGAGIGRVVADGTWSGALLPALPLALGIGAEWARVLRGGLRDALGAPHSETARARGAGRLRILALHGLPHAAAPFLTVAAMSAGGLLAGAAVVETLFTWPGIGRLLITSIDAGDLPVVQAIVLLGVVAFLAANLLAETLTAAIDPRRREKR
ncbi:ABC transporter permease [Phytomonospora endophytica]|uniref:ABC-type dipeptide/oligopeptide/nickel transport system permease component n=1 Tax=Phytomonospora endophytica TaxID=714109 RepID=A0A841FIX1_9ACTN|nr:ABC transporter permease [Phytomonospora endophytica]MBB6034893.1 ABC-type dipeptide/oligopeptide/nickel transport system permease component [Phytomonospora endophytica]GIG70597.1 glutathione ABC transporter permease [Phytomonospora endophytica]